MYHNKPRQLLELRFEDGVIRPTENHPFYVRCKGWTQAINLEPGDQCRTHGNQWVELKEKVITENIGLYVCPDNHQ